MNRETGEEIQRFYWVFGNGMREAFVLEVGTVMPQNSVPWQQLFTFKRMDAFDQGLESKVDAPAEELAFCSGVSQAARCGTQCSISR